MTTPPDKIILVYGAWQPSYDQMQEESLVDIWIKFDPDRETHLKDRLSVHACTNCLIVFVFTFFANGCKVIIDEIVIGVVLFVIFFSLEEMLAIK